MVSEYQKPKCAFTIEASNVIKTDGTVKRKITGTSLGAILGFNPFASAFKTACDLLGLADRDISDEPAVHTGIVLEPVIIDYHNRVHNDIGEFIPADDVFAKKEGSHDNWKMDFEDDTFGGHVDGFVSINGEDYILECKTAKNLKAWENGVPEHYFWQVALYNHFITHKDKAFFVLGIVTEADYKDPHAWVPNESNCLLFEVDIDQQMVAEKISEAKAWYEKYIATGTTPPWCDTDPKDMVLVNHLRAVSASTDRLGAMLDRLCQLEDEIDEYDVQIQDKRVEAKELRESIRDALITNGKSELTSQSGEWFGTISESKRAKWDESKMKKDGIDVSKYKSESTVYIFKPKRVI